MTRARIPRIAYRSPVRPGKRRIVWAFDAQGRRIRGWTWDELKAWAPCRTFDNCQWVLTLFERENGRLSAVASLPLLLDLKQKETSLPSGEIISEFVDPPANSDQ